MANIDLSYLENITSGDNEVIVEMIELFLEETPKHLKQIETLYNQKEWQQMGAEAHKVKPMFLYVGLIRLNNIAQELENNGKKAQNLKTVPELIQELKNGYDEVKEELENKITQLS